MNYGPLLFLAAFFALASSWLGLVLTPQIQIGRLDQTNTVPAGVTYPVARPGLAREGLQVYRANGCAYCHSQQVGQTGTMCDVVLTEAGTNREALLVALRKVRPSLSEAEDQNLLASVPKTIRQGLTKEAADSAAEDFLYDFPVMPGSQRIGPDLANVGLRLPDAKWHLLHLYAPRNQVRDSAMPPYRFLF